MCNDTVLLLLVQYIVEEKDRLGSEQAFWEAHSDKDGCKLTYQKILNKLQHAREEADRADAAAAKEFFQGDLTRADTQGAFMYRKGGTTMIYKKDRVVAQQWRELLKKDPDISARWEAAQAATLSTMLEQWAREAEEPRPLQV